MEENNMRTLKKTKKQILKLQEKFKRKTIISIFNIAESLR